MSCPSCSGARRSAPGRGGPLSVTARARRLREPVADLGDLPTAAEVAVRSERVERDARGCQQLAHAGAPRGDVHPGPSASGPLSGTRSSRLSACGSSQATTSVNERTGESTQARRDGRRASASNQRLSASHQRTGTAAKPPAAAGRTRPAGLGRRGCAPTRRPLHHEPSRVRPSRATATAAPRPSGLSGYPPPRTRAGAAKTAAPGSARTLREQTTRLAGHSQVI
jgi:hypothetical protein